MGQYRCTVLQYRFTILCRNSLDLIQGEWPNSPQVVQTFIKHTRDSQPGGSPNKCYFYFNLRLIPSPPVATLQDGTNFLDEKVRVAYVHPPSRSCRGLEGPFWPCWEPLAPSLVAASKSTLIIYVEVNSLSSKFQPLQLFKQLRYTFKNLRCLLWFQNGCQ